MSWSECPKCGVLYRGEHRCSGQSKFIVEWESEKGIPFEEEYETEDEAKEVVRRLKADGIVATYRKKGEVATATDFEKLLARERSQSDAESAAATFRSAGYVCRVMPEIDINTRHPTGMWEVRCKKGSQIDWKRIWQKAMEKMKADPSKFTDADRSEIYSAAQIAGLPLPIYAQIGRDLHIYRKYDAYAMWVNPDGGFLSFAKPEDKPKVEHFLFAVGQYLNVISIEAEFPEAPKKASLYEFLKVTDVSTWNRKQILDHVKNKENWKKPTSEIRVKAEQKEKVLEALSYYLGGAEAKDLKDGTWVISSRGYYHYIGA